MTNLLLLKLGRKKQKTFEPSAHRSQPETSETLYKQCGDVNHVSVGAADVKAHRKQVKRCGFTLITNGNNGNELRLLLGAVATVIIKVGLVMEV